MEATRHHLYIFPVSFLLPSCLPPSLHFPLFFLPHSYLLTIPHTWLWSRPWECTHPGCQGTLGWFFTSQSNPRLVSHEGALMGKEPRRSALSREGSPGAGVPGRVVQIQAPRRKPHRSVLGPSRGLSLWSESLGLSPPTHATSQMLMHLGVGLIGPGPGGFTSPSGDANASD